MVLDRGATLSISDGGTISKKCIPRIRKPWIVFFGTILFVLVVAAILYFSGVFQMEEIGTVHIPDPIEPLPPSISTLHVFKKAAVCADGIACAEIGRNILERNGSAVDAAIGAMICNGMVNMQSMGIGGGFLMTIYSKAENKAYTLNARETAPLASTPDMFGDDQMKSKKGPLAIGVPGELKGYYEAHKKFGKLPWRDIVQPNIQLCEKGYPVNRPQSGKIPDVIKNPIYREWFVKKDGTSKIMGDTVVPTQFCNTLRLIAEKGPNDFYTGQLAKMVLEDLNEAGSIITKEDFLKYNATWEEPVTVNFNNGDILYSVPPPGSGVLLAFILKILDGYNFTRKSIDGIDNTVLTYHRTIEAFKHAYARRTELGDTQFVNISKLLADLVSPDYAEATRLKIDDYSTSQDPKYYGAVFYDQMKDNGTAHISILGENGDAVSVTSTINLYFGSEVVSKQTGITFNCVMDDFSNPNYVNYFGLPGSPNNALVPGKRALSSMSPSVITDQDGVVKIVVGASGGTKITTGLAQVIMRLLWLGENVKEAVDAPRIHHQVYPMEIQYEYGVIEPILNGLKKLGHKVTREVSFSVVCALFQKADNIFANADHRKGGDVYGINS